MSTAHHTRAGAATAARIMKKMIMKTTTYNVDSLLGSSEQVAFHNLRGPFDFPKEDEAHLDVAGKQSQVQAKKKVM